MVPPWCRRYQFLAMVPASRRLVSPRCSCMNPTTSFRREPIDDGFLLTAAMYRAVCNEQLEQYGSAAP